LVTARRALRRQAIAVDSGPWNSSPACARDRTETAEPLERAVTLFAGDRGEDRDRPLVLITDGQVENVDLILQTLRNRLNRIRVHTIGIERAVNEGYLRRFA
jgi:Ca-activated chloride channel family protein